MRVRILAAPGVPSCFDIMSEWVDSKARGAESDGSLAGPPLQSTIHWFKYY